MHNLTVKKIWAKVEKALSEKIVAEITNEYICIQLTETAKIKLYYNGIGEVLKNNCCYEFNFNGKVYIPAHITTIMEEIKNTYLKTNKNI